MNKLLVLVLLAAYVAAGPVKSLSSVSCSSIDQNKISCYLVKVICALEKAAASDDINIIDGVDFVRDTPMERTSKRLDLTELEMMNDLPSDMSERAIKLWNLLHNASDSFWNSHSLSFKLSKRSVSRALDEGRAKLKKILLPVISIVGIKFAVLIPFLLIGLGYLAFKAYILGKIALIVAGITAFEKFLGSNKFSVSNSVTPAWNDIATAGNINPAGYQYAGYRSLNDADAKVDVHNLAYSAHVPVPNVTE